MSPGTGSIGWHWAARDSLAVQFLHKGQGKKEASTVCEMCFFLVHILGNWFLRKEACLFPLSNTACYSKQP